MKYEYRPQGTCSRIIYLDVEDGVINEIEFVGGCHGNLQGISKLVEGMDAKEAVTRLEGIKCGFKKTSCPDQLAQAVKAALEA